jgi:hypothetical protein
MWGVWGKRGRRMDDEVGGEGGRWWMKVKGERFKMMR